MTDELSRAYGSLAAFAHSVPAESVPKQWADDFNSLLIRIGSQIERDLSEFKVTDEDLFHYRDGYSVRHGRMAFRLNAALNYINLLMPEVPMRRMGF